MNVSLEEFFQHDPQYKDGWWYWVNDSYARLKRMSAGTREQSKPRRLAHLFTMEYMMTMYRPSRKRKRDD